MGGSLAPDAVVPRLRGRFGRPYRFAAETESTQRLLDEALPEGAVAVADHQTAGRGRLGRVWESHRGAGLLVSVLLRPDVSVARLPALSVVAAEAVAETLETVGGIATTVKHPNDVLVGGRKVAGILGEARDGVVVLGIGVNVNTPADELPAETRLPATSLLAETGRAIDRAGLLVELLDRLQTHYDAWLWREPGATALVVPVPQANPLVGELRRAHTPSGGEGVGAHVTVLAPFARAERLDTEALGRVHELAYAAAPLRFTLTETARWPGVLYLPPEPAEPFVALIEAFVAAFPATPPYGGRHDTVVPHVTVASGPDESTLDRLAALVEAGLPIHAEAERIELLERRDDGRFTVHTAVPLGPLGKLDPP